MVWQCCGVFSFFFVNDTAPPPIYFLSLHDALPISMYSISLDGLGNALGIRLHALGGRSIRIQHSELQRSCGRSEEHTSELQSHHDLVCRLLIEKKKRQHAFERYSA